MNNREAIKIIAHERDNDAFVSEYRNKVHEAQSMAIKALEQSEWIPVKSEDDYPETREDVFVTYNDGKVGINSVFTGYAKGDYIKTWNRGGNVIAWRPLPEPYKGDTE